MSTLIFDIETVGEDWQTIDSVTQASLLRWAHRVGRSAREVIELEQEIKDGLGFSPLTSQIVALGLYDLERQRGVVYYTGESSRNKNEAVDDSGFSYRACTEKDMLRDFWEGARHYDTFVTFNGRAFDAPFLFHRSAVHKLRPTKDLLEGRYPYQQKTCRHIDLQDELTFYGAMLRRPSLHLFCRAYGIASPKQVVSGDDVAALYRQNRYLDIARYNAADVNATRELYERWLQQKTSL